MAFFKKKQEAKKMTTLEEVRKAYEDLSEEDKKRFDEGRDAKRDEANDGGISTRLDRIESAIRELMEKNSAEDKLSESKQKYGFAPRAGKIDDGEKLSPEEAIERLRRA